MANISANGERTFGLSALMGKSIWVRPRRHAPGSTDRPLQVCPEVRKNFALDQVATPASPYRLFLKRLPRQGEFQSLVSGEEVRTATLDARGLRAEAWRAAGGGEHQAPDRCGPSPPPPPSQSA